MVLLASGIVDEGPHRGCRSPQYSLQLPLLGVGGGVEPGVGGRGGVDGTLLGPEGSGPEVSGMVFSVLLDELVSGVGAWWVLVALVLVNWIVDASILCR